MQNVQTVPKRSEGFARRRMRYVEGRSLDRAKRNKSKRKAPNEWSFSTLNILVCYIIIEILRLRLRLRSEWQRTGVVETRQGAVRRISWWHLYRQKAVLQRERHIIYPMTNPLFAVLFLLLHRGAADADGIWEEELYEIPYNKITSVSFDTRYVNVFSKYL